MRNDDSRATDGQRAGVLELTEQMIDAARPLFLALECGATSIEDVRGHLSRGGMVDIDHLPEWFRTGTGHLTKAGRAIIAWHLMLAAAPTPPAGDAGPFAGVSKVERESDFSVRLTFDSCRQASAFDRAAMAAMADSKGDAA